MSKMYSPLLIDLFVRFINGSRRLNDYRSVVRHGAGQKGVATHQITQRRINVHDKQSFPKISYYDAIGAKKEREVCGHTSR